MNRKRSSYKKMQSLCGEIHADDGVDPRDFFRPEQTQNSNHRKARQLCRQVAETLSMALSDESDDDLRELQIVSVDPAPDASQLLVLVAPALAGAGLDPGAVMLKLSAATGRLRAEVASAITRRRAPTLCFQFIDGPHATEVQP